jgi:HAE1 family hydrophobic/amphiphilic exporter-1
LVDRFGSGDACRRHCAGGTGAGAKGLISLGLSVLSGIIASTCLAVLLVPSCFSVLQGFEEWRKARKRTPIPAARPAE